ncbi:MAG: hypothetical protein ACI88H_003393 [Cocleimonas sp.]|jgi:hypothetical protein
MLFVYIFPLCFKSFVFVIVRLIYNKDIVFRIIMTKLLLGHYYYQTKKTTHDISLNIGEK